MDQHKKVLFIGVAGGSGSGKTTFSQKIVKDFTLGEVCILHMDSYYVAKADDTISTISGKPNFDHPDSFDWELLTCHLRDLRNGLAIDRPIYDFKLNYRTQKKERTAPAPVIILEGIFALYEKKIRDMMDVKIFLLVDSDIRFTRRLHRDVNDRGRTLESVIGQYYDTVRPMYEKYLSPQKNYADISVGEETDVAANLIKGSIKDFLK